MQSLAVPAAEFKTREQAAYEVLRREIVAGRWGAGEPLVVSRLAGELGVSRITVANALKRLAGEGFVRLTPHKEATVARPEPDGVREIYLMRAELEALAAREAAGRVSPAALEALDRLNGEIGHLRSAPEPDIRAIRAVDLEFHHRLRHLSGMPRLAHTLDNLADQCEAYRARLLDPRHSVVPDPQRHLALLAALGAGDAAASGAAMRQHILEGMEAVLANLR